VLDQGLLGDLHYGEVDYYHGIGPWYGQFRWNTRKDAGGSALLTAGCHALDALLLCLGTDVKEVTSYETRSKSKIFEPYEYATSSITLLKFKSGRIGKCAAIVDLPSALLLPHPPCRERRQSAGQQISFRQAPHQPPRLEHARDENA